VFIVFEVTKDGNGRAKCANGLENREGHALEICINLEVSSPEQDLPSLRNAATRTVLCPNSSIRPRTEAIMRESEVTITWMVLSRKVSIVDVFRGGCGIHKGTTPRLNTKKQV